MINKVTLIGHIGKDPEVRSTSSDKKVASFSLATDESYKDKSGQKIQNTEWHNIVVWGTSANFVEKYLKKGDQVYIEGKIKYRSYDDKDGNKKYITEILANEIKSLSRKENKQEVDDLEF